MSYNGGCKKHLFTLVAKRNFKTIENIDEIQLKLVHNSNNDNCKKIVTEELFFNLLPLKTEFPKENHDQKNNGLVLTIENRVLNYK